MKNKIENRTDGFWKVRNARNLQTTYFQGGPVHDIVEVDIMNDINAHVGSIRKTAILKDQVMADAYLMSAAPDLYEALDEARKYVPADNTKLLDKIFHAIKKAKGEIQP